MDNQWGFTEHDIIRCIICEHWFTSANGAGVFYSSQFLPIRQCTLALILTAVCPYDAIYCPWMIVSLISDYGLDRVLSWSMVRWDSSQSDYNKSAHQQNCLLYCSQTVKIFKMWMVCCMHNSVLFHLVFTAFFILNEFTVWQAATLNGTYEIYQGRYQPDTQVDILLLHAILISNEFTV